MTRTTMNWPQRPPSDTATARVFCIPHAGCGVSVFRNCPAQQGPAEFLAIDLRVSASLCPLPGVDGVVVRPATPQIQNDPDQPKRSPWMFTTRIRIRSRDGDDNDGCLDTSVVPILRSAKPWVLASQVATWSEAHTRSGRESFDV
jgi:hypothetical protein